MSVKPSRVPVALLGLGCLTMALAIGLPAIQAQDHSPDKGVQAQVETLRGMAPKARRAALKKMTPEERRGLWFELKREQAAEKGLKPLVKGAGLTPHHVPHQVPHQVEARPDAVARRHKLAPKAGILGTIKYDNDTPMTIFGGGAIIGNRFDTAVGDPIATSGTISTVVGVVQPGPSQTTSSAGFVIEGPQTVGGGAFAIFSTFTGGLTASTETVTYSGLGVNYTGSSFFVLFGDFASSYDPAFSTGSTQGQGHHGVVGYTGMMGPNITGTFDFGGSKNALVRVTGNVLPVELMSFDVE